MTQAQESQASEDLQIAIGNEPANDEPNDGFTIESEESEEITGQSQDDSTPEEKLFDQEAANKAFIKNKQKLREEQKQKEAALKEAEELKKRLAEFEREKEPEVPNMPDPFDDDFEKKVAERDEAIRKAVAYQQKQEFLREQKSNELKKQQEERESHTKKVLDTYRERVKEVGFTEEEQIKNENVIAAYIQDQSIAEFILSNDDGPLLIKALAENPVELERIAHMNAMQAAVYITNIVAPNAKKLRPQTTKTPAPAKIQHGSGYVKEDPLIAGAHFE